MGRGIRRLVVLFESIDDLVTEADNRYVAESEGTSIVEPVLDEEIEQQIA